MLSHICLKFKSEGLKQQETLNGLPKAIRSSIAHYLFFPIVQKVHLFQGVSNDFLFQLVLSYKLGKTCNVFPRISITEMLHRKRPNPLVVDIKHNSRHKHLTNFRFLKWKLNTFLPRKKWFCRMRHQQISTYWSQGQW